MPYDDQGNYVEDNPAQDFAVQTGGAPAPTSSFAVQTGGAPRAYLTPPDMSEYLLDKNWADSTDPEDAPGTQHYVGANAYTPQQLAAIPNYVGPPGTGVGAYDVRNWDRSSAGRLAVDPNATYRVLNGSGEVVYEGSGEDAAKSAAYNANLLTADPWTANATVQAKSPSGDWSTLAAVTPKVHKDDFITSFAIDIIPQIIAAGLTGGSSLMVQMAAAAAATVPGSLAYQKSLKESLLRAAMAAGATGVGNTLSTAATQGAPAGFQVLPGSAGPLGGGAPAGFTALEGSSRAAGVGTQANIISHRVTNGAPSGSAPTGTLTNVTGGGGSASVPAVSGDVAGVTVTGAPRVVSGGANAFSVIPGAASSIIGQSPDAQGDINSGGNNNDPMSRELTPGEEYAQTRNSANAVTAEEGTTVEGVVATARKLNPRLTSDMVAEALAKAGTVSGALELLQNTAVPETLSPQGVQYVAQSRGITLTPEQAALLIGGGTLGTLTLAEAMGTAPASAGEKLLVEGARDAASLTAAGNVPLTTKIATGLAGLTTAQKIALGLKVASAGTLAVGALSGGSGGGSGGTGTGGVFKTIDQQRAGLPDIFRAQPGAPRGMFSALGTAGTPYTPRPISNLIPDPVVNTNGSGNPSGTDSVNPSGTAALSDYLRRYPDVAAEAKANPGAYGDVNDDNVIDDNDFALVHYLLHGKDEGRTLAVKTGGYIQHPSRDTDMHNSRFQVMRKAKGGTVDEQMALAALSAPTSAASMGMSLPAEPVPSQLAQSLAVDPRALAESYRSGTVAPPSVMQQRQSPYSGYEPGTMGGMYHYGESPAGETQHFNYALAQGSVAPWMASTPTGTGVYNMFGVKTGGAGAGASGAGTGATTGTTTTNTPTPISDAERAKWTAYVNAYPDLAKAFAENSAAYKDFNNDGKVDIADFGLGQYTNYGKAEGRALTGPAATLGAPADTIIGGANTGATDADAQKLMSSLGVFNDPTGFHYQDADYAKMLLDQYHSGALDPGSGTVQQLKDAGFKAGGSPTRNQFAVRGPGTGRSDSIPAALSDGEYVMDAETVALLGDGSSKAGAKKLDAMRGNLRKHKGRSLAKGRFSVNAKAPEAYLSGGRT